MMVDPVRRWWVVPVVALFVTVVLAFSAAGPAAAASFGTYSLTARADLFLLQVYDDRVPVIPPGQAEVELSPATSQALVDSLGSSRAFASAPYPGESVVGLPGLIGGLGQGDTPPLPRYPVYVSTAHPTTDSDTVDQTVYQLHAASTAQRSEAGTSFGGGEGAAFTGLTGTSSATVEASVDAVTALARARVVGISVPELFDIADVVSTASISAVPGEEPVAATSFQVGAIDVGGVALELGPDGLRVADTVLPFDSAPVEELFGELGMDVEYIPPETGTTEGGAVFARSAGLVVTYEVEGTDGLRDRFVLELGRAFATADARPAPQFDPLPMLPDPPVTDALVAAPNPTPPAATSEPVPLAAPPTPQAPSVVGQPDVAAPAATPLASGPTELTLAGEIVDPLITGFYPVLGLAAVGTLATMLSFGSLGVRSVSIRRVLPGA